MTNQQKLQDEYAVTRTDGKDAGPYFVLDYGHDEHARAALLTYADGVEDDNPELAAQLQAAVADTIIADVTGIDPQVWRQGQDFDPLSPSAQVAHDGRKYQPGLSLGQAPRSRP